MYQAGTLSGNPLATAAGLAVLAELDVDAYDELDAIATALADGLRGGVRRRPASRSPCRGSGRWSACSSDRSAPADYDEAKASVDRGRYPAFFHGMLDRGIALAPGPYEVMFPSLAHSQRRPGAHDRGGPRGRPRDGRGLSDRTSRLTQPAGISQTREWTRASRRSANSRGLNGFTT